MIMVMMMIMDLDLHLAACMSGVQPCWFRRSTDAPFLSRNRTRGSCPPAAASISAVFPSSSVPSTCARPPGSSRTRRALSRSPSSHSRNHRPTLMPKPEPVTHSKHSHTLTHTQWQSETSSVQLLEFLRMRTDACFLWDSSGTTTAAAEPSHRH